MKTFCVASILCALVVLAGEHRVRAAVPGFQGTVNHYRVGMHEGCPQRCSQWMNPDFQAFEDGRVESPITIQNDTLRSFCGAIKITVRDRAGNPPGRILGVFQSATYCIKGKGGDTDYRARTVRVPWSFRTNPDVGRLGADLYAAPVNYRDNGVDFGQIFKDIGGTVVKIAGPIISAASH